MINITAKLLILSILW